MSKPSPAERPAGSAATSTDGSTSQTRAVALTAVVLAMWAALTLAAPWLAQPVTNVVLAGWDLLGMNTVTAEDVK